MIIYTSGDNIMGRGESGGGGGDADAVATISTITAPKMGIPGDR